MPRHRVIQRIGMAVLWILCLCGTAYAFSAQSAIVLDAATGAERFAHHADMILPMASTTKIMTALVAIEQGDLDREYIVKPEYTRTEGSSMYLKPGEKLTIRDTLYGLMLMSGNDAALAIAGECGGQQAFVAAMNDKAAALGLTHTHFDNPNGLDGQTHHTTARELAQLTAYALQNPDFRQIVSTKRISCAGRTMVNHNKMLSQYEGAIGVKTGYTKKAGRCLVSAAERQGRTLIVVTLNDPDDWADHAELLNQAFDAYQPVLLHSAGEAVETVMVEGGAIGQTPLYADHDLEVWLTPEEQQDVKSILVGRRFVYAPVVRGEYYGQIVYQLGTLTLGQDSLSYGDSIEQLPPRLSVLERWMQFLLHILGKT